MPSHGDALRFAEELGDLLVSCENVLRPYPYAEFRPDANSMLSVHGKASIRFCRRSASAGVGSALLVRKSFTPEALSKIDRITKITLLRRQKA
jgi:hypothetical protein